MLRCLSWSNDRTPKGFYYLMTYIAGINSYGASAIICDTRITYGQSGYASNDALKSGKLFPGCVYGGSGDFEEIRKFIVYVRRSQAERDTLSGFWDSFCQLVSTYPFSTVNPFELVLASRHSGQSMLYVFDSRDRSIKEAGDIVTIGSGKTILDDGLREIHRERNPKIMGYLVDQGAPAHCFPYLYCLWLMERAQGMEVSTLHKHGVGGYFHFTGQTAELEARQRPAVYVMSEAYRQRREIRSWIFRVSFAENALVVDCPVEQARFVVVDVAVWPEFKKLSPEQKDSYIERVKSAPEKEPYYFFCGFGFINPRRRKSLGFHFTERNDYFVNRKGQIVNPDIKSLIEENFAD